MKTTPKIAKKRPLTARQREVFEFIKDRIEQDHRPPTLREIGERFQIGSTNGVRSILTALDKKNYIARSPKLSRGIEISGVSQNKKSHSEKTVEIPILGRVAAGMPIEAVENLEGTVIVDKEFLMRRQDVFALRVQGNSMIEAGILSGDLVFARKQSTAEAGQVVVALLGEEATVKYFFPELGRVRLEPANPEFGPIVIDDSMPDFSILGRVIGVMRRY